MDYFDYHEDDGTMFRKVEGDFEVELSNGWTVGGYGELFCNFDDVDNADDDDFFYRIDGIGDSDGNEIQESELKDSLYDEFYSKFKEQMRNVMKKPMGELFRRF